MQSLKGAQKVLKTLMNNGCEAYLVGGCVRDMLLGKKPVDYDVTTSCLPDMVEGLFERTLPIGKQFGTIIVHYKDKTHNISEDYEVTTFRSESEYTDGRRPSAITFSKTLSEDLERRDFTINAMAMDIHEKVYDFFGGLEDLNDKIIRTVGDAHERFSEDYLRMMRAIRFATTLDFELEDSVKEAIKKYGRMLAYISMERINVEFTKLLVSDHPSKGLKLLKDLNLWHILFPNLQLNDSTIELMDHLEPHLEHRMALLFSNVDEATIISALKRLKYSKRICAKTAAYAMNLWGAYDHNDIDKLKYHAKKLIITIGKENIHDFLALKRSISKKHALYDGDIWDDTENLMAMCLYIVENNIPLHTSDLAINGRDLINLGYRGREIGIKLSTLLEKVLKDESLNNKDHLYSILTKESTS